MKLGPRNYKQAVWGITVEWEDGPARDDLVASVFQDDANLRPPVDGNAIASKSQQ